MPIKVYLLDWKVIKQELVPYDEVIFTNDFEISDRLVMEWGVLKKYIESDLFKESFEETKKELEEDLDDEDLKRIESVALLNWDTKTAEKAKKKRSNKKKKTKKKKKIKKK